MQINLNLYQSFLHDSDEFVEANNEMDATVKAKPYNETFYLRDNLQIPHLDKVLSKRSGRNAVIEFTNNFKDTHIKELGAPGPIYTFLFGSKETSILYGLFNVSKDVMLRFLEDIVQITYNGKLAQPIYGLVDTVPHKILITGMLVNALQNNYTDIVDCCEYIMAFAEYPMVYKHFWKKHNAKEDVMEYTMEHLPSKFKSKTKNLKTLSSLIKYDINLITTRWAPKLKIGMDHSYFDYIYRCRTQMKNSLKNIADQYYNNYEKNATQHERIDQTDDGNISAIEGQTAIVGSMVDNTYSRFLSGELNKKIIAISSELTGVDKDNVYRFLNQIFNVRNNRLHDIIENIILSYFTQYKSETTIVSEKFLNYALALYRRISTSNNVSYSEIRKILDYWMFDIIDIKSYYNNEGTITYYTRAIYNYIVFMINHYIKV